MEWKIIMEQFLSSLQNPLVKHLAKLRLNHSYREEHGSVLVEGKKLIQEISSHTKIKTLLIKEGVTPPENISAKESFIVTEAIINKIAGTVSPEGILAEAPLPPLASLQGKTHILALDGVRDPGNMGTLLRTALALGWDGVFLLDGCVDPFNDKALRAAKGATFRIPIRSGAWSDLLPLIAAEGWSPLAADIDGIAIDALPKQEKVILILGNEGEGISATASKNAKIITIPMSGKMESLNVAVAGGILMHILRGHQ